MSDKKLSFPYDFSVKLASVKDDKAPHASEVFGLDVYSPIDMRELKITCLFLKEARDLSEEMRPLVEKSGTAPASYAMRSGTRLTCISTAPDAEAKDYIYARQEVCLPPLKAGESCFIQIKPTDPLIRRKNVPRFGMEGLEACIEGTEGKIKEKFVQFPMVTDDGEELSILPAELNEIEKEWKVQRPFPQRAWHAVRKLFR